MAVGINEVKTGETICSPERYKELKELCMKYDKSGSWECRIIEKAAIQANPGLWKYILRSVLKDLPYEYVMYDEELGKIPVGESEFYAYRRLFYHNLNQMYGSRSNPESVK